MRKNRLVKFLVNSILLALACAFVAKFAGPQILRTYIQIGIGDCAKIPILCMAPQEAPLILTIDKNYIRELTPLEFPKTKISAPKGFKVVQELIKKPYYKKKRARNAEAVIYLLHQPADFFINLFPQVKKSGIKNNSEFWRNIMYARQTAIFNLNDAFFVIMKSIFTPDLGDQRKVKMIHFKWEERAYFISYNLSGSAGNLFDCSIIAKEGDFFKVYIKDRGRVLDLNKVFSILSTIAPA